MPRSIPADVAGRMSGVMSRMRLRGQLEMIEVWGDVVTTDPDTGEANGTRPRLLVTLQAHRLSAGGGNSGAVQRATEGIRVLGQMRFLFAPDVTGSLTEANYAQRKLRVPSVNGMFWRITQMRSDGPYDWCDIEAGGTVDRGGQTR